MNLGNGMNATSGSAGPPSDLDRNEGFNDLQQTYATSSQSQANGSGENEPTNAGVRRKKDGTAKRRTIACFSNIGILMFPV